MRVSVFCVSGVKTIMKEFFSAFSYVREKECNEGMTNTKICKK